ncbi:DNA ligase 1-like [Helianthus annuus]|uniref:DNA ligase 1-like n=1 Tax=Helianthus annuus TaxID=4232 RepID=UPI000B907003|nr:DNA ligase 1-like [Helianthus annuus]
MSINAAKQQMSFLASVLESYEGLVSEKIGNSELTKEDYDRIDPVEMELIDIHWCLENANKAGIFKREFKNSEVDETEKPFSDDYYRKAIYHRSKEEPRLIENNPKEKSRACAVIQDDEGYDWSEILPEEDLVDNRFTAHGRTISKSQHRAYVAEIKMRTREEILKEKTKREIFFTGCRIEKMKDIVHDDVLAVIPLSDEYYSNIEKDKTYLKKLDKIIRDVMTVSLKKRDEERMKKNVEDLVDDLKKVVEEVKVEAVKAEEVKEEKEKKVETAGEEAVIEKQQKEEVLKKEEEKEVKVESSVEVNSDADAGDEKKKDADQTQTDAEENTEVPITEINSDS